MIAFNLRSAFLMIGAIVLSHQLACWQFGHAANATSGNPSSQSQAPSSTTITTNLAPAAAKDDSKKSETQLQQGKNQELTGRSWSPAPKTGSTALTSRWRRSDDSAITKRATDLSTAEDGYYKKGYIIVKKKPKKKKAKKIKIKSYEPKYKTKYKKIKVPYKKVSYKKKKIKGYLVKKHHHHDHH